MSLFRISFSISMTIHHYSGYAVARGRHLSCQERAPQSFDHKIPSFFVALNCVNIVEARDAIYKILLLNRAIVMSIC